GTGAASYTVTWTYQGGFATAASATIPVPDEDDLARGATSGTRADGVAWARRPWASPAISVCGAGGADEVVVVNPYPDLPVAAVEIAYADEWIAPTGPFLGGPLA